METRCRTPAKCSRCCGFVQYLGCMLIKELALAVSLWIHFHPHICKIICTNRLWLMSLTSARTSHTGWWANHFARASVWHMDKRTDVPNRKFTTWEHHWGPSVAVCRSTLPVPQLSSYTGGAFPHLPHLHSTPPPLQPNPIIKAIQCLLHAAQINDEGLTWRCRVKLTRAREVTEWRLCACGSTNEHGDFSFRKSFRKYQQFTVKFVVFFFLFYFKNVPALIHIDGSHLKHI